MAIEPSELPQVAPRVPEKMVPPPEPKPLIQEFPNPISEKYGQKPSEIHGVKVYQGDAHKMETFNEGENGEDRAVPFQLKAGEQGMSFALAMEHTGLDPNKDPDRVVNLDDSRNIPELPPGQLESTVVMRQDGDTLVVKRATDPIDAPGTRLTRDQLRSEKFTVNLDHVVGVDILDFDPALNRIVMHKTNVEPATLKTSSPSSTDQQKWDKTPVEGGMVSEMSADANRKIPDQVHGVKVYDGDHSQDVLNHGDRGRHMAVVLPLDHNPSELAQSYKNLRILSLDPKNPGGIEDLTSILHGKSEDLLNDPKFKDAVIIEGDETKLTITQRDRVQEVTPAGLDANPLDIFLRNGSDAATLRLHKYITQGINSNNIIVEKVAKKGIGLGPLITLAATGPAVFGGGIDVASVPPMSPPAIYENVPVFSEESPTPTPKAPEMDPRLKCDETRDYTIKENESLSRALIEVNGLGFYLTPEGKLDVPKIYEGIACMVLIPENRQLISSRDKEFKNFIDDATSPQNKQHLSPLTPEMIYDGLEKINNPRRYPNTDSQLELVHTNDNVKVPVLNPDLRQKPPSP